MMNKKDVKEFFDNLAPEWEINLVKNDSKINTILDYAGVDYGKRILDVACGTGVLFPYYMERGAYLKHLFLNEFNGAEKYIFVAAVKDLRYNKKLTGNFYKGGRIEK